MSFESTTEYLYGLQKFGMKFGLRNTRMLLAELGDPQTSFRSVHIAGTNGKGSTSMFIESILRTAGVTTGLFTSPHLSSFTERIRVNGEEMSENDVISLAERVRTTAEHIKDFSPTFFEVVTAMAFLYFREKGVDWGIIEVGMGGRLDATNVIDPQASVITPISMDHREFLGQTLTDIAGEKAGIIKEGIPLIVSAQAPESMVVLQKRCAEQNALIYRFGSEFSSEVLNDDPDKISFIYRGATVYDNLNLPLPGDHQIENASVAIKCAEVISGRFPDLVMDINKGIREMRSQGRAEFVRSDPPILIDGAHNPGAADVLACYIRKKLAADYRRVILILGIMGDKDIRGILASLLPIAAETICTRPGYGRAARPEELVSVAESLGFRVRVAETVKGALTLAESLWISGDLIVVTGSFYTTGEAREALVCKGVLANLRE